MQYASRLTSLQSLLRKQHISALLVTTPANILYLTGVDASEGMLLVQPKAAALFVDSRYLEAARALRSRELRVFDRAEIARIMPRVRRCGYEEHHVTAGRLRRWKALFKNTKFIHTSDLVEGLRRKKDASEIIRMKRALAITDDVLRLIPRLLKPGITEKALAGKILLAMLNRGADGMAFDPIVAFGSNSSVPHHQTGNRKLRIRDIVQIDIGARYRGYCADRSEVYFVGEPTSEQRRVYEAVLEAKNASAAAVRAGVTNHQLELVGIEILKRYKLHRYMKGVGHGLGLVVHELPTLSGRAPEMTLQSGEAVTVEPGVYLEGKFGIRLEDTVFVK